ncbi:UDP-glucose 4-epimerase GalE [bacterium AH-315-P15]|nr:UDP-glucose 4-epimerase GalE [bacterium AH-315-P15]
MLDKQAVLVTGGAGYIGSHTCKALARGGFHPVTYDNLSRGHEWAVRWGPLEQGDVLDRNRLDEVLAKYDFLGALHFAAAIEVGESIKHPAHFYRTNIGGAATVIEALSAQNISAFVFSSTAAVYGLPEGDTLTEAAPLKPINPYGESKLAVEKLLLSSQAAYGLQSVSLRYFNAAGADEDGEIGEEHDPETHLIPLALSAINNGQRLKLFGTDYPTPDGTAIRDYIHVSDLAEAHVSALRYLLDGGKSTAFNLGASHGFSVREVLASIERVTGTPVPYDDAARREGDPAVLVADPSSARRVLGFEGRRSQSLDLIVKNAWDWIELHRARVVP